MLDTTPHHIILKSRGGSDVGWNLVSLCVECHRRVHGSNDIIIITHPTGIDIDNLVQFIENPVPFIYFDEG